MSGTPRPVWAASPPDIGRGSVAAGYRGSSTLRSGGRPRRGLLDGGGPRSPPACWPHPFAHGVPVWFTRSGNSDFQEDHRPWKRINHTNTGYNDRCPSRCCVEFAELLADGETTSRAPQRVREGAGCRGRVAIRSAGVGSCQTGAPEVDSLKCKTTTYQGRESDLCWIACRSTTYPSACGCWHNRLRDAVVIRQKAVYF